MVGPRTGKPKVKPVARPAAAEAAVSPAPATKPIAAKAAIVPPSKPMVTEAPEIKVPEVKIPKVAATPAPAPEPAPVAKAVPEPAVVQPVARIAVETPAKAVEALPEIVEKVAESATKGIEKVAAIPVAAVKAVTPPPAAKPTQKGLFAMTETITSKSFVPTPENIQAMFGDMSTRAKTAMENGTKMAEELGEFAKGNVEALMTSSRVAAKGAETLGQEAAAYSKKSLETATSAFKGFASAKSPTELFKLQSDYARSSFDAAVAESSKFSEALMKLFGEITQPISTRVSLAAEKIKTPAF